MDSVCRELYFVQHHAAGSEVGCQPVPLPSGKRQDHKRRGKGLGTQPHAFSYLDLGQSTAGIQVTNEYNKKCLCRHI